MGKVIQKVIRKLVAKLVNNDVLKDTIILTYLKSGKQHMFDTYMAKLMKEGIHGMCVTLNDKPYAVYSEAELYSLFKEYQADEPPTSIIPMSDLEALDIKK